ncbi:MAG: MFS transporter [Desulfobacterales bacterium]|nr:MFS transporter [Desulfobacterales bacterium]
MNGVKRGDGLLAVILINYNFAVAVTTFLLTVYLKENLGFSGYQIGILFSAQAITGILAAFPAGIGNDRINSRLLIFTGLFLQALCYILMALTQQYIYFLILFFCWTLSSWIFRLSTDVYLLKTDYNNQQSKRIGNYHAYRFIGLTLGTLVFGLCIERISFPVIFIASAVISLLLIIPAWFLSPTPIAKVRFSDYHADFMDPQVLLFACWLLLFATHWGAEQASYPLFLKRNLHLSIMQVSWYLCTEYITIMVSVIFFGNYINSPNRLRINTILGLFCSGIGHIGMIMEPIFVSVLFRIIHGFGDGCILLIMYKGMSDLFSIQRVGGNAGLINVFTMIGYIIGALIYSPLGEKYGYQHPLWLSGLITLCLMLPFLRQVFRDRPIPTV